MDLNEIFILPYLQFNKWYYTPEQALDSFFRSKLRGILPYLLVRRAPAPKLQHRRSAQA
jgi:hypothetical protein